MHVNRPLVIFAVSYLLIQGVAEEQLKIYGAKELVDKRSVLDGQRILLGGLLKASRDTAVLMGDESAVDILVDRRTELGRRLRGVFEQIRRGMAPPLPVVVRGDVRAASVVRRAASQGADYEMPFPSGARVQLIVVEIVLEGESALDALRHGKQQVVERE